MYVTQMPNDRDLARELGDSAITIPLECGDVNFFAVGGWKSDKESLVLVERKKIGDLVNSIHTGRYLHQAQNGYEFGADFLILIVEGEIKASPEGLLMTRRQVAYHQTFVVSPKRRRRSVSLSPSAAASLHMSKWYPVEPYIDYSRFSQYLDELHWLCGIQVKRTSNVVETAAQIKSLWQMFHKPPDKHRSLEKFYHQPMRVDLLKQPSLIRKIAAELPGIGWERSKEIAVKFGSVANMIDAGVADWMKIPGIGKSLAQASVAALHSKYNY
jgi:ERCC4-type nuclease